jgi:hypothetical protein
LVYEFRQQFLDGGVITPEQAQKLLSSSAAAVLPSSYFTSSGPVHVPIDHEILDYEELGDEYEGRFLPFFDDEGEEYTMARIIVDPPGTELTAKLTAKDSYWEDLFIPDENGRPKTIEVELGSLLGSVHAVCNSLLERRTYPRQEHQAAWFLLTGEPPRVPALAGGYQRSSNPAITDYSITMTVKPWVPAETVRRYYGRLQERLLEERPRSLSERNLAVFRFVVEKMEVNGTDEGHSGAERPRVTELRPVPRSWRTLLRLWNGKFPEGHKWHYTDVRNFSRDFGRAKQAILHPRYKAQDSSG